MAQLGRLHKTFQDSNGVPIAGLTIEVRKQGATVNGLHGGPQNTFTVDDPGGVTDSPQDQLQVGTNVTTRSVSSVAGTSIVVGGPGFSDVQDEARLTPSTNLPVLYLDAEGDEPAILPLTTDANGEIVDSSGAACWAPIVPYDIRVSGTNYQTRLIQDVLPEGHEGVVSNIFPSGTAVAFQKDTLRPMVSGSKLERWLSGQVEKFYIDLNGSLEPRLPAHHVIGPLTIDSGGITVSAGTTAVQALTATTGLFSSTLGASGLLTASGGLTVSGGVTTLRADLSSGSPTSLDLQDDTPTTTLRLSADSGGGALISALDRVLTLTSGAASGSRVQLKASASLGSNPVLEVLEGSGVRFEAGFSDGHIRLNSATSIFSGANTPEGAITAPVGSVFLRTNGGANTTLYVKESGAGNTGWVAK